MGGLPKMDLDVNCTKLNATISHAGTANLRGYAANCNANIAGRGNMTAYDLSTNKAQICLNGMGSCRISVLDEINAQISGLGELFYKGNPQTINKDVSHAGKLQKVD